MAAFVGHFRLANAEDGIEIGCIFSQVGVATLLGALQLKARGRSFPGLELRSHPVPAMPVVVAVHILGQPGNGLCRRTQQGLRGGLVKAHAALDVAEAQAQRGFCGAQFVDSGQGSAAMLLQQLVGRFGLIEVEPEVVNALELLHGGWGKVLLPHQFHRSGDAVLTADAAGLVVVVVVQ